MRRSLESITPDSSSTARFRSHAHPPFSSAREQTPRCLIFHFPNSRNAFAALQVSPASICSVSRRRRTSSLQQRRCRRRAAEMKNESLPLRLRGGRREGYIAALLVQRPVPDVGLKLSPGRRALTVAVMRESHRGGSLCHSAEEIWPLRPAESQ